MPDLNPRPIRVAPGVRERVVADMESRPESAHAVDARESRAHDARMDAIDAVTMVQAKDMLFWLAAYEPDTFVRARFAAL